MYRTVERHCSLDEMHKLCDIGGIGLNQGLVEVSGLETTITYVFSQVHNPFRAVSFMNEKFSKLVAECAGCLWWPENEKKHLLMVRAEDKDGNEVTWLSELVVISQSILQEYPQLANVKDFIDAASQSGANEELLPVVVTFESLFYLPVPYYVIDESFKAACPPDVISALPFCRMPYGRASIP